MTGHLVKRWCRICNAHTVQTRVTLDVPPEGAPHEVTVCSECREQVD